MNKPDYNATREWLLRLAGADDDQVLAWYHSELRVRYYVRQTSDGWQWREGMGSQVTDWYDVQPSMVARRLQVDSAQLIHESRVPESEAEIQGVAWEDFQP